MKRNHRRSSTKSMWILFILGLAFIQCNCTFTSGDGKENLGEEETKLLLDGMYLFSYTVGDVAFGNFIEEEQNFRLEYCDNARQPTIRTIPYAKNLQSKESDSMTLKLYSDGNLTLHSNGKEVGTAFKISNEIAKQFKTEIQNKNNQEKFMIIFMRISQAENDKKNDRKNTIIIALIVVIVILVGVLICSNCSSCCNCNRSSSNLEGRKSVATNTAGKVFKNASSPIHTSTTEESLNAKNADRKESSNETKDDSMFKSTSIELKQKRINSTQKTKMTKKKTKMTKEQAKIKKKKTKITKKQREENSSTDLFTVEEIEKANRLRLQNAFLTAPMKFCNRLINSVQSSDELLDHPSILAIFEKGDRVLMKNFADVEWKNGVITSTNPIMIKQDGWWPFSRSYKQIRRVGGILPRHY